MIGKIIAEIASTLWKEAPARIQEAKEIPNKLDSNRSTPRHTVIRIAKSKERDMLSKTVRETKNLQYKGETIHKNHSRSCQVTRTSFVIEQLRPHRL